VKESSGTLLYRPGPSGPEVLIVHPSGSYNRHAPWSIPKGVPNAGEELETAARRETWEETGLSVTGPLTYLGHIVYKKSKKRVHCYGGPAPEGEPRCASWEIDQARYVSLDEARALLHTDQQVFVGLLEALLAGQASPPG
jgi:predicted NUDIX family NTP pyrophosphohydrolase